MENQNRIIIENLRSIKKMEFILPKQQGVYLLVGANGKGKSSILTCLDKIGNCHAFQYGFRALPKEKAIDSYQNTRITYKSSDYSITYTKNNQRWVASPVKDVKQCLKQFNFASTIFISADPKRISYTAEEPGIRRRYYQANDSLKKNLNELFDTDKYNNLFLIHTPSGKGRHKNVIYCIKTGKEIYTEKQFSSGELALIRLLSTIENLKNNSMILIDEVELALHPRTQKKLLKLLENLVADKNLTVFLSTHSPSLIYQAKPEKIYLLKQDNIMNPCSHAMALGDIDIFEPNYLDNVYLVEDYMAMLYLESIRNRYKAELGGNKFSRIYPVGGYLETSKLGVSLQKEVLWKYKVIVFLDEDVKFVQKLDEQEAKDGVDKDFRKLYYDNRKVIKILPITPEVALVDYIKSIISKGILQEKFHVDEKCLESIIILPTGSRKEYKNVLHNIMVKLEDRTGKTQSEIYKALFKLYVQSLDIETIKKVIGKYES